MEHCGSVQGPETSVYHSLLDKQRDYKHPSGSLDHYAAEYRFLHGSQLTAFHLLFIVLSESLLWKRQITMKMIRTNWLHAVT